MGGRIKNFLDSPDSYYCTIGACIPLTVIILYTSTKQGWGMYGLACAIVLLIGACILWICTIPARIRRKSLAQYGAELRAGRKRS
jgi:O-antigen ligase